MRTFSSLEHVFKDKRCLHTTLSALALLCAGSLQAQGMRALQQHTFDHYQVIIDRLPFGDVTETALSAVQLSAQQAAEQKTKEEIAAKLHMCGLTVTPANELCAAFIDSTVNPAINYFLTEGESKNGFKLISANREKETATILREQDALLLTFKLGKGLIETEEESVSTPPAEVEPAAQPSSSGRRNRRSATTFRPSSAIGRLPQPPAASESQTPTPESLTYKERLAAREAEKAEAKRVKEAADESAREKAREIALQDAIVRQAAALAERREQIERIKRGEAPTAPIKLTEEEDAELVQEGIFE